MNKIEALTKHFGCNASDISVLDEYEIHFDVDGDKYALYDDEQLEEAARKDIEQVFNDCYTDVDLSHWVKENGGLDNFYDEVWINDFRIEDSETFADMSDSEIISYLEEVGYTGFIPRKALDMEKMVDYVWDIDGAQGLSRVDGNIEYCEGYSLIKED